MPLPPQPSPSINHKTGNGRVRRIDAGWVGSAASLCVVCRTGLVTTTEKPERCETPTNVQRGTRTCDRTRSALFYTPSFEKMDFFCQARLTLRYSSASKSPAIDVSLNRSTTVRTVTHTADGTRVKPSSSTARGHGTLQQHWPSCFLKAPRPPSCSQCLRGGRGWGWGLICITSCSAWPELTCPGPSRTPGW